MSNEAPVNRNRKYLSVAIALFACGAVGGILNILGSGSLAGALAQVIGYCGAGYFISKYLSEQQMKV